MDGPHQTVTIEGESFVRPWNKTPLIRSAGLSRVAGCNIYLKLENLQPSGSFKSRGIGNILLNKLVKWRKEVRRCKNEGGPVPSPPHLYTSSGGNAGLACVHAANALGCQSTVVVPLSTTPAMVQKIKDAGASEVIQTGPTWVDADRHLVNVVMADAQARGEDAVYVHPFDDPLVWDGHSTMIHEAVEQLRALNDDNDTDNLSNGHSKEEFDAVICSVGGGGLLCGVLQGLDHIGLSNTPVIAVETDGADSFSQSISTGELVTLPGITSIATSLGAKTVAKKAFEYGQTKNITSVVYSDRVACNACVNFADLERMLVEPACGVSIAVCFENRLKDLVLNFSSEARVLIIVCGGSNVSTSHIEKWRTEA